MAKLQNSHTSCLALGLALSNGECFYASAAGPSGAVRSVWASLVSNNSGAMAPEWYSRTQAFNFTSKDKEKKADNKTLWSSLGDSSYHHFVTLRRDPNVILLIDPTVAGENDTLHMRVNRMDEAYYRFYLWLKANYDLPVLREWAKPIWHHVNQDYPQYLKPMQTYGDCIAGWFLTVNAQFWTNLITDMVRDGKLKF